MITLSRASAPDFLVDEARQAMRAPGLVAPWADAFLEWEETWDHHIDGDGTESVQHALRSGMAVRTVTGNSMSLRFTTAVPAAETESSGLSCVTEPGLLARLAREARAVIAADPAVLRCGALHRRVRRRSAVACASDTGYDEFRTMGGLALSLTVKGYGRTHTVTHHFPLPDPDDPTAPARCRGWARQVLEKALALQEAVPAQSGEWCVIFGPGAPAGLFHEACGHGLEGDHVITGRSAYAGLIGRQVASPLVSLVDDPTLPGGQGSYGFDDEGCPSRPVTLIENGVLKGYLHDRLSAARMAAPATGHGRRAAYRYAPQPRMGNTIVLPGTSDPDEIVKETAHGLFVTSIGDGHTDPVTGQFSIQTTEAWLVEDGRITAPVWGATLSGNGPAMLQLVDRVGCDLQLAFWTSGGCLKRDPQPLAVGFGQPTLRVARLAVQGASL